MTAELASASVPRAQPTHAAGERPPVRERVLLGLFCVGFLGVNLATATLYPIPWLDEVCYADPAINLYFGKGFVCYAMWQQPGSEFFAGLFPLYPWALCGWMEMFGYNLFALRAINYVLMVAAVVTLWSASWRLGLVRRPWSRLLLVVMLFGTMGMIYAARNIRYDALSVWMATLAVLVAAVPADRGRRWLLFGLGILYAFTGLPLVVYAAVTCAVLWRFLGRAFFKDACALGAGCAVGLVSLLGLYASQGVARAFLIYTVGASTHTLTGAVLQRVANQGDPLTESRFEGRLHNITHFYEVYLLDLSWLPAAAALALAIVYLMSRRALGWLSIPVAGLAVGLIAPITLRVLGHYPVYYTWMGMLPVAVGLCYALERLAGMPTRGGGRAAVLTAAGLGTAAAVVLGPLTYLVLIHPENEIVAPGRLEEFVRTTVRPDDTVFGPASTYFAARQLVKPRLYIYSTYAGGKRLPEMPAEDARSVSLLIVSNDPTDMKGGLEGAIHKVGGEWAPVGEPFHASAKLTLQAYRRKGQ